jgi:hypothetical protein
LATSLDEFGWVLSASLGYVPWRTALDLGIRTVTIVSVAPARPPAAMLAITEGERLSMGANYDRCMGIKKRMKYYSANEGLGHLN